MKFIDTWLWDYCTLLVLFLSIIIENMDMLRLIFLLLYSMGRYEIGIEG